MIQILENGVVRDATPEEITQRAIDEAAAAALIVEVLTPTKEQLMAEIAALTAKIKALDL
jgi:hypothetical protein